MKKTALFTLLAVAALSVALRTHVQASSSMEKSVTAPPLDLDDDAPGCSNETLEGLYGLSISGTRPAPPPLSGTPDYIPGTIEQFLAIGVRTFDGAGNMTQVATEKGSLSGIRNTTGQGTYSVNPDCSGTSTQNIPGVPFPIINDFVIVKHGTEFHTIFATPEAPQVMVSATGQKE